MTPHPSTHGISRRALLGAAGASLLAAPLLSGCGSDARAPGDLRVSFQQWGSTEATANFLATAAAEFMAARPGTSVEIVPLVASENDYFTKNELMMASARTAPDVVYEDTFILKADIAAGYLRPLDDYVAGWPHWDAYYDVAKDAVRGEDGRVYAIPGPTDTRAVWYHRGVLERAGIPLPWNPRSWNDLLDTARTVRDRVPDVVPGVFYAGKAQGEKASLQGLQMLFNGTGSVLYDESTRRWTTGAEGMRSALGFLHTLFAEGLGPPLEAALDPNFTETVYTSWMPEGTVGFVVDGNWITQNWDDWPEWPQELGLARMPTRHGQGSGFVTLSGGMAWSLPARAPDPDRAWELLATMMDTRLATGWTIGDSKLANRRDVVSAPGYEDYSPVARFFTDLVPHADYRPALAPYPQISSAIQAATEAVMTGAASPADAADGYDAALTGIVGAGATAPEARP
ncbi:MULTISPECIES: extracellular solute-binding protein [unclassified Pseudonocardia]|uniref:extracellular solute-binding protein n=1 Tax=unclassified Pseudonocardia TaxID=2619320 RepID=UPI0001FFEC19|nr:extracellular solute-binding protein [Pseudonocardia sp. Ae707_Ps1]OLM20268.1 N-Acetyl-D-glucosamine ABC transport system, sugar-binding protein [Pseudonocardia sp. Ae707_Ps1]